MHKDYVITITRGSYMRAWFAARMIRGCGRLRCNQYNIEHVDVESVSVWSMLTIDFSGFRHQIACISPLHVG